MIEMMGLLWCASGPVSELYPGEKEDLKAQIKLFEELIKTRRKIRGEIKMATKCKKCGGIIPDLMIDITDDRNDCKNHTKPEVNLGPNFRS